MNTNYLNTDSHKEISIDDFPLLRKYIGDNKEVQDEIEKYIKDNQGLYMRISENNSYAPDVMTLLRKGIEDILRRYYKGDEDNYEKDYVLNEIEEDKQSYLEYYNNCRNDDK